MRRVLAVALLLPTAAAAQTWTSAASGNWSDGTNWSSAPNPPTSGATTALVFPNPFATAYTATNDFAGGFSLNALTLNNASNSPVVLANGASATLITTGSNPAINVAGPGPVTLSGTTLTFGIGTLL